MQAKVCRVREQIRTLTTDEIDRRISRLVAEVGGHEDSAAAACVEIEAHRPRWISAAELVRRMRPFIVLN